ncbi:DapH/DapD/GlmU-related protein [Desulfobulbus sp.]|uniref:acyltransferase n=1 Tax=Desulfobulbus sp. TaxID=895 RepID=UPI0027B8C30D|nr:acyltransferase [Desulfobulbus sp.]
MKFYRCLIFLENPGKFYCRTKNLKNRGMKIGDNVKILHSCVIDDSRPFLIEIGNNVTIAPLCHLLTHDASMNIFLKKTRIGKIIIHDNVFIGANSVILPNVSIGPNAVVGAGSVVTKDVPENSVVAGNPARQLCQLQNFIESHEEKSSKHPCFSFEKYHGDFISGEDVLLMKNELSHTFGYSAND